jgi:hypothetical protein
MNHYSHGRLRALKCLLILLAGGLYATTSLRPSQICTLVPARAQTSPAQRAGDANENARFDELVRADFFAGMMGDEARLTRGMKFCEDILAQNPKHAEALVWHGGGLLTRAAQAYARDEQALGDKLWQRGLAEMNKAVEFEPQNMGVKIGRSATLIGLAQAGWDSSDEQARALLLSALADYEKVYRWQKPTFHELSIHSRGELLFGLASGWSILGERQKAVAYLRLIVAACKGTSYEREARHWLSINPLPVVQHDCIGCHIKPD